MTEPFNIAVPDPFRCDDGLYTGGVFQPTCDAQPSYRYQWRGNPDAAWRLRCARHARLLDRQFVVVEPLSVLDLQQVVARHRKDGASS